MMRFLILTCCALLILCGGILMLPHLLDFREQEKMSFTLVSLPAPQEEIINPNFEYASLILNDVYSQEIKSRPVFDVVLAYLNAAHMWGRTLFHTTAADFFNQIETASGAPLSSSQPPAQDILASSQPPVELENPSRWSPDQDVLTVEAVLVPRSMTVISSSHDGRISDLPFSHGDRFKKGDVLVRYACEDLDAEAAIIAQEQDLTRFKAQEADELFKLDIISNLERKDLAVKNNQTELKRKATEARRQDCTIRANFDGRVAKRLANPGEYTRTDRVLMEVVSDEALQAEFILPSKWLRWVNVGAPLSIKINETETEYEAFVSRIYGQVDPVSQSIQMVATLEPYQDNLLPGMSGQAVLNLKRIQDAGVKGYLEISRAEP